MAKRQTKTKSTQDIRKLSQKSVRALGTLLGKARDASLTHGLRLADLSQQANDLEHQIELNRSWDMDALKQEITRIETADDSRIKIFGYQTKQLSYSAKESIRTLQRRLMLLRRQPYSKELHELRQEIGRTRRHRDLADYRIECLTNALDIASAREKLVNERKAEEKERKRLSQEKSRAVKASLKKQLAEKSAIIEERTKKVRKQARLYRTTLQAELCIYCCKEITDGGHQDHIYPVSRGGRSVEYNLVMVCARCNQAKSDLPLYEFCQLMNFDFLSVVQRLIATGKKP